MINKNNGKEKTRVEHVHKEECELLSLMWFRELKNQSLFANSNPDKSLGEASDLANGLRRLFSHASTHAIVQNSIAELELIVDVERAKKMNLTELINNYIRNSNSTLTKMSSGLSEYVCHFQNVEYKKFITEITLHDPSLSKNDISDIKNLMNPIVQ